MIPVGVALERLWSSMGRTAAVVGKVAKVRREASKRPGIKDGIGWGLQKRKSAETLYDAVVSARLPLYAWPTRPRGTSLPLPEAVLRPIPVELVMRLRPLHGGLPLTFVGGRRAILKSVPGISPFDVPVFERLGFDSWMESERRKGSWVTQKPLGNGDRRARVRRRPGRPSIRGEVEEAIEAIVQSEAWNNHQPVSRLARAVRNKGISANDDTVRMTLDGLYIRTGDLRFQSKFFFRRNPRFWQR